MMGLWHNILVGNLNVDSYIIQIFTLAYWVQVRATGKLGAYIKVVYLAGSTIPTFGASNVIAVIIGVGSGVALGVGAMFINAKDW